MKRLSQAKTIIDSVLGITHSPKMWTWADVFCFILGLLLGTSAFANPVGGQVAGGQITITTPDANSMQINQSTNRGIINWQTYNIAGHEHVNYLQPNSSSITLNRINGANGPSSIFGSITANGRVWLVNPAGIWFAPGSHVDVAGLLATTANIRDEDFMAGHYLFNQEAGWNGAIVNEGTIIIREAGLAAFIGVGVVNKGDIIANLGTVVIGSSKSFVVDFSGDQLINFAVDSANDKYAVDAQGKQLTSAVSNVGTIVANGGRVVLSAQTAGDVLDHAINMSGSIEAKSVGLVNGEIILSANQGTVEVSGKLIASGKNAGETGGTVIVTGNKVALSDNTLIDVSGDIGGG